MKTTNIKPNEQGGADISGGYTYKGSPVIPTVATYSLFDRGGNIMNSLENIPITPLAETFEISLNGDDLAIPDNKLLDRYLLIKIEYGSGKKNTEQLQFFINDLIGL